MPSEVFNTTDPHPSGEVRLNFTKPKETPPPPEPKPAEKPPEKETPKDDLEKNIDDILAGLGYGRPKPEKEPEKTEPKPDETAKPAPVEDKKPEEPASDKKADEKPPEPEAGSAEKPKSPEKKPAKTGKKAESYDAATIQALARDAATQVVNQSQQATEPQPSPVVPEVELDDKERRNLDILRRMEADNPGKYKGLADKTLRGTLAFKQYKAKWEVENPDEEFDPDADDHQKIVRKLLPDYDQEDFDDTRITMRSEEIISKRDKEREKQDAQKEAQNRISQVVAQSESDFVKGADEQLYKLYIEPDGVNKMAQADKLATRALGQVRQKLVAGVTELEKLMDPKMGYEANPNNPIHAELGSFALDTERAIKQLPLENQLDVEGKRFVTRREFDSLTPAQKEHAWILTKDHLLAIWTKRCAEEAKVMIQDLREAAKDYAKAQGFEPKATAPDSTQKAAPASEAKPNSGTTKPNPPSTASSADAIKTTDQSLNTPPDLVQTIVKGLFS